MKTISRAKCPIAAVLVFALTLSGLLWAPTPVHGAENFIDTVGHWADEEIRSAVDYGYINGYSDGRFLPDSPIRRSEFVKIVNSAMGYTALGNIAFTDVPSYEWYYNEVRKAAAAGYIAGYDGGTWFAPNSPITREEVATVLFRISPGESSTKTPRGLKDVADIGEWAIPAVNSAYTKGYLSGYPDGNFYPRRNLTRAESVKVINKVLGIDQDSRAITEFSLTDYTDVRAVVNATSRNSGTLYWVLLEDYGATPTPTQISQGRNAVGETAFKKGNAKVKAYEEVSIVADGLTSAKPYTMYATVKASDGKLSNVRALRFDTEDEADRGENWLNTFSVGTVTETTALLTAGSTEKGTFYYVLVENSSGKPSQTNVAAGNDRDGGKALKSGSSPIERNTNLNIDITGLKVGTSYSVYGYVSKNADEFSRVESRSFTTAGVGVPTIRSLSAVITSTDMLEITASVSAKGTFYWIAVNESGGALPPTPEKVKAGTANEGQSKTPVLTGSLAGAENTFTTTKSGISLNIPYRVYACMEGPSGALSPVSYTGLVEKKTTADGLTGLSIGVEGGRIVSGFSFDVNTWDYINIFVSNGSSYITVRPTASQTTDIIVNGRVVANGANSERIKLPDNTGDRLDIKIVTSESGKSTQVYNLAVYENKPVLDSVYVSGATPENPSVSGNISTSVPKSYMSVNISVTFSSEFTAVVVTPDGSRTAIRSGERRTVNLNAEEGSTTAITIELAGPANGGDRAAFTLNIVKDLTEQ
jgi:hypothetical protein